MVRIYSEYYLRKYYAPYLSTGSCCCVLAFIITIVLPFLLAFATTNFWTKISFYHEQPLIRPNENVVIQISSLTGTKYYSSMQSVQRQYAGQLIPAFIESSANDNNGDGLNDEIHFKAKIPIKTAFIRHIGVAIGFSYELLDIARTGIDSGIIKSFTSSQGISDIEVSGAIVLKQRETLKIGDATRLLYHDENILGMFMGRTFSELEELASLRNQSLSIEGNSIIMPFGNDEQLTIEFDLRVPTQKILYEPRMLEVLKFAWCQYMSFLLPIYAIIYFLYFWAIYKNRVVDAKVVEDPIVTRVEKLKKN